MIKTGTPIKIDYKKPAPNLHHYKTINATFDIQAGTLFSDFVPDILY